MTHTRSRGGCSVCKRKHIKCDEARPQCKNCTVKHIVCPGYAKSLIWKTKVLPAALEGCPSPWYIGNNDESAGLELTPPESTQDADTQQTRSGLSPASTEAASTFDSLQSQIPEFWESAQPGTTFDPCLPQRTADLLDPVVDDFSLDGLGSVSLQTDWLDSFVAPASSFANFSQHGQAIFNPWTLRGDPGYLAGRGEVYEVDLPGDANDVNADNTMIPAQPLPNGPQLMLNQTELVDWDSNVMPLSSPRLDFRTSSGLIMYYFEFVCQILSCFDSHENPFRSDIPSMMLTCDYLHDCVIGMSAAHLANSRVGMKSIAMKHQARAMAGLSNVIQTMQVATSGKGIVTSSRHLSSRSARYQALLAAMLLGISSAWYDASASEASLAHLFGARSLFQAWLLDEGLSTNDVEPTLLNRQQSFIVGAMVYLECLASFIHDQTFDALAYIRRFGHLAEGQVVYPNPWTGVSTPLFVHLAETAIIMRFKRFVSASESQVNTDRCKDLAKTARLLYRRTLLYVKPATTTLHDTKDDSTPIDHLMSMDKVYRLVILMELVQAFPELIREDDQENDRTTQKPLEAAQGIVVDFAIAILSIIACLPEKSGANIMLSIPLIAAGSVLQTPRAPASQLHTLDASQAAREVISAVMHHRGMLQVWRDQVIARLRCMQDLVGLAPLRWVSHLIQEVWHRADQADPDGCCSNGDAVKWMDIMTEEKLETLFG